jgi:hypothetical protein
MLTNPAKKNSRQLLARVSDPELVSWIGEEAVARYEVSSESSFARLRRGIVLTNIVQPTVLALIAVTLFGLVLGTAQDVIFVVGVPLPALVFAALGVAIWTFIATKMLWHSPMSDLAREPGIGIFVIGLFFTGSGYLIDGPEALILTSRRGKEIARLMKSDIAGIITVDQKSNVGTVIKAAELFFEIPIVMQLHGPVARRWSMAGYAPQASLQRAIQDRFADGSTQVVEVDKRYKPLSKH